jgi:hypothetical protein
MIELGGAASSVPPAAAPGGASPAPSRPVPGPVRFARYAYGPNRLGYCGPDGAQELFEQATVGGDERALRALAEGFEGAWPYLELIARANGIADPLDDRVVEAYWLGNELLERVTPALLGRSLEGRFRPRLRPDGWRWLATKPTAGAVPVHAFHVLDVFPRVGLLRSGALERVVETIDSCRIRWGRVLEHDGDWLVVATVPLVLADGRLVLAPARAERIRGWQDGAGFIDPPRPGEVVSIHWDWACERLDARRYEALVRWTVHELALANRTI